MDPLAQILMQRQLQEPQQPQVTTPPYTPPPEVPSHLPSRWQRWLTAQKMIAGYQNNYQPNPTVTNITNK